MISCKISLVAVSNGTRCMTMYSKSLIDPNIDMIRINWWMFGDMHKDGRFWVPGPMAMCFDPHYTLIQAAYLHYLTLLAVIYYTMNCIRMPPFTWNSLVLITVYPKKYAHGFCFAVLCCGYTLTDFPISIRLTSLALWQSNDCPSARKATLMNMDKYFIWIHYERLHNHNKAKHNKTVCIFLGIYCRSAIGQPYLSCLWHHVNHF